jgi:hypothetical protein
MRRPPIAPAARDHAPAPAAWPLALLLAVLGQACSFGSVDPERPDVRADRPSTDAVAPGGDGDVTPDAAPPEDSAPEDAGCRANGDFVIDTSELPAVVGATVTYVVNRDGTTVSPVDTAGADTGSGARLWDYAAARAEDHRVLDEVLAPAGQWWAGYYPTATFALVIDRANQIYGVYRRSADTLELLGTVSMEANRTNLTNTPPVAVIRLPLAEGAHWSQMVTAQGIYNFAAFSNVTTYNFSVDAHGEVRTPAGRFPVLRLRLDLDQSVPLTLLRRTQRTYTFVSECWGVAARVGSADNETAVEFTQAAEYLRLGL